SRSVFLSYASADRPAAQALRDALQASGLEVWYDESGLDGGDAWDQKIRRQIRECDFFMPLISANTEARPEGYFRREWRLAVETTLDMADDLIFLLPVAIDDTPQGRARVPEKFLSVQWLRLPGGQPTAALDTLCRRLLSGKPVADLRRQKGDRRPARSSPARLHEYPPFPAQQPGQPIKFGVQAVGWAFQSGWMFFKGLPRWVQLGVYVWLAILLMSKGCTDSHRELDTRSHPEQRKLNPLTDAYRRSAVDPKHSAFAKQLASEISSEVGEQLGDRTPLLAIPFSAPADKPAGNGFAESVFAQVYGKLELTHQGQVRLVKEPLAGPDLSAAIERGRAMHSEYVLFGSVDESGQTLTVKVLSVPKGTLFWSASYPVATADPAQIASDVSSKLPSLKD